MGEIITILTLASILLYPIKKDPKGAEENKQRIIKIGM